MPSRLTFSFVLLFAAASAPAEELLRDSVIVPVEKGLRGPRGMMGDIVQLKDGSMIFSYTRNSGIRGIKSTDGGHTWGDDLALVGYHARDGLHLAHIKIDWFYDK